MTEKKEKLLDEKLFAEAKLNHLLGIPHKEQPKDLHPLLDHYDKETNERLARKLFEE